MVKNIELEYKKANLMIEFYESIVNIDMNLDHLTSEMEDEYVAHKAFVTMFDSVFNDKRFNDKKMLDLMDFIEYMVAQASKDKIMSELYNYTLMSYLLKCKYMYNKYLKQEDTTNGSKNS